MVLWTEWLPEDRMTYKNLMLPVLLLPLNAALLVATAHKPTPARTFRPITIQQRAEHRIKFVEGGTCTATAVGPHALLTAEHCNEGGLTEIKLDLSLRKYKLQAVSKDGRDHVVYIVDGPEFHDTVPIQAAAKPAGILEQVYIYGAGGGQYPPRRLDGQRDFRVLDISEVDRRDGAVWYTMPVIPGDSGSAIFGEDGRIIALVTYRYGLAKDGDTSNDDQSNYEALSIGFDLNFTPAQIANIQTGIGDEVLAEHIAEPQGVENPFSFFKLFK